MLVFSTRGQWRWKARAQQCPSDVQVTNDGVENQQEFCLEEAEAASKAVAGCTAPDTGTARGATAGFGRPTAEMIDTATCISLANMAAFACAAQGGAATVAAPGLPAEA